ncbi:beta clamp domain-containing protein [Shewanella xiamenensis]|uniref:hypothetical protein n=1 Tax=Shewanella xiamenensis TaxID=332186 RepID=UPI00217E9E98|nr:hypothetical protein [Shewanella xiamenensis]MCT8871585.1 hypothetical protein [Shewanella xiamenensis]UWH43576.1 hypothetical protein KXJ80_10230 [Shewanella xiamenensis]
MKTKFNIEYLPMLAAFAAKNDVRYFLNGFHVKPHPEKGVILTATDGHCLVTIHDEDGFTDGDYIYPISKELLKAANKKALPSIQNIFINDGVAMLTSIYDILDTFTTFEALDTQERKFITHIEFINPIDGRYPNAGKLFKSRLSDENLKPASTIGMNVNLLSRLSKLNYCKINGAVLHLAEKNSLIAVMGLKKEIVAIIMPMTLDESERAHPAEFVYFAGHQPVDPAPESATQTTSPEPEQSSAA